MKDNRFVASFDKVSLPIEREEALLARILTQADAERASYEKEQEMYTEYRRTRENKPAGQKPRKAKRWPLALVACLLLAITLVACIPEARAAVSEWLRGWFSATNYFRQDSESRTMEPTIEAIITDAGATAVAVTEIGTGHEDYAKAFSLSLEEIAYDGDAIYMTGTMPGAVARPFVQAYTGGDTFRYAPNDGSLGGDPNWKYYYFACENAVFFETDDGRRFDGEISPNFTEEMREISSATINKSIEPVFENGRLVTTNPVTDKLWDAYLADHDVRFTIELMDEFIEKAPLSGIVNGALTLQMWYDCVDGETPERLLRANLGNITIDANAYKAQTTQVQIGKTVQLGGVHPVTISEWQPEAERTSDDCEVYRYTRELDFTGATVTFKEITFTPTDTKLTLHVQLPASWTEQERQADGGAIHFRFLLDGEDMQKKEIESPFDPTERIVLGYLFHTYGPRGMDAKANRWLEYDYDLFTTTISPSQWAAAKSLTIIPTTEYFWEMLVNYDNGPKEPFSLQNGAVYTGIVNHTGYEFETLYDEMPEYAITVNLDDYR